MAQKNGRHSKWLQVRDTDGNLLPRLAYVAERLSERRGSVVDVSTVVRELAAQAERRERRRATRETAQAEG